MKILLQRVNHAAVVVDGETIGQIGRGLLLLVGIGQGDTEKNCRELAEKVLQLRIFPDEKGRFHHSLFDIKGELLLVPQFTLYADTSKGRRPDFFSAMPPAEASPFFDRTVEIFRDLGAVKVETGRFGAMMQVSLENDGPVTIMLEG